MRATCPAHCYCCYYYYYYYYYYYFKRNDNTFIQIEVGDQFVTEREDAADVILNRFLTHPVRLLLFILSQTDFVRTSKNEFEG
jgi:hypothetical protein